MQEKLIDLKLTIKSIALYRLEPLLKKMTSVMITILRP